MSLQKIDICSITSLEMLYDCLSAIDDIFDEIFLILPGIVAVSGTVSYTVSQYFLSFSQAGLDK